MSFYLTDDYLGIQLTSSGSSYQQELGQLRLPSTTTTTSSHQPKELEQNKNNSPTWNIVNNLWDAVNSSVIPTLQSMQQQLPQTEPAVISTTSGDIGRSLHTHRKSVTAELSSDESDFELLDTDDLNINNP